MAEVPSPDPIVGHEPTAVDPEMAAHIATWNGFLSLTKWFIIHMALILVGLYFMVIAHNMGVGILFFVVSVCLLIYGVVKRPEVQEDLAAAAHVGRGSARA
jgi:hypothetical protein